MERGETHGAPPVELVSVTGEPLDVGAVYAALEGAAQGAVVLFVGRVRDHTAERDVTHLDYEAYAGMAESELRALAAEARQRHGAEGVALVHRVGRLEIGAAAVIVAASAGHRPAAFAAARWLIDTLKERVPIWKREHFGDGSEWISERP